MKTLYLERSTGECRNGDWVEKLELEDIERIVVGIGPGSFAGIRSALAFAQGYALGKRGVEVYGLPSPCAIAAGRRGTLAVVGDARQGKLWIALFKEGRLERSVYQIDASELQLQLPADGTFKVISPDDKRIGNMLKAMFGERYLGEAFPTVEGLKAYAEAYPEELIKEPLPIYLNPAVRN